MKLFCWKDNCEKDVSRLRRSYKTDSYAAHRKSKLNNACVNGSKFRGGNPYEPNHNKCNFKRDEYLTHTLCLYEQIGLIESVKTDDYATVPMTRGLL